MSSKRIKVCYVTHEPNLTGASQSLLDMLDNLDVEKYEPIVLIRKEGPLEDELKARKVNYKKIYYSQSIKVADKSEHIRSMIKTCVNAIEELRIAMFFKIEKVDIVHNNSIFTISGMKAAQIAHIPYICHIREVLLDEHALRPISMKGLKKCISKAAKTITISTYVCEKYKAVICNAHCETIYDGIKVDKYYSKHLPILDGNTINILLAGRLEEAKGQIDAIKAIEILNKSEHNYKLYIAGSDAPKTDYPNKIRRYVKENKLKNIYLLGFQDLKKLRAESDICLICSTNEALGRVAVEGMLAGCLVIGANACAIPEIVLDGETGLLYQASESESLARIIEYVSVNKEQARELAKQGQKKALLFDAEKYMRHIEHIYSEIILK